MSDAVSASLTSATNTSSLMVKEGVVSVTGTFVGTWRVETDALGNGAWGAALDSTGAALTSTVAGVWRINNGVACPTRVACSAYTSGTLVVGLRNS